MKFYVKTKHELDIARAASIALDHKKRALQNLVQLHGQNYFAGPKIPRTMKQIQEDKEKRVYERMKKKSNK